MVQKVVWTMFSILIQLKKVLHVKVGLAYGNFLKDFSIAPVKIYVKMIYTSIRSQSIVFMLSFCARVVAITSATSQTRFLSERYHQGAKECTILSTSKKMLFPNFNCMRYLHFWI